MDCWSKEGSDCRRREGRCSFYPHGPEIQSSLHPSKSPSPYSFGFTLIELLVALALLAILGASLAGVLRNTSDSVNQASAALDQLARLRSLDVLLGGALNDAVNVELSSTEQQMLAEDGLYDAELGTYRFRGELLSIGFCMEHPFLSAERDGWMHWITLDAVEDETTGLFSLWLKDVSFIPGMDNPIGDDWGDSGLSAEERLPVQEVRLLQEVEGVVFTYWMAAEDDFYEEFEEMDPDEISGDYALAYPDRIDLELKGVGGSSDVLQFDYNLREDVL